MSTRFNPRIQPMNDKRLEADAEKLTFGLTSSQLTTSYFGLICSNLWSTFWREIQLNII